jgi:hypothetical protein
MITQEDLERLVGAHEKVKEALDQRAPRRAAKILCEELGWLVKEKGSFWDDVRDATKTLSEHREVEKKVIGNLPQLIEDEESIFERLGIDRDRSTPILRDVYGGVNLTTNTENPTPDSLKVLQERLDKARELVCKCSRGPIARGRDWLLSWRGLPVLAGTAIVGANVAVMIFPPHVHHISWVSVKTGVKVARGNVDAIIDMM